MPDKNQRKVQDQYQVDLGVFIDNEFVWHTVKTYSTAEAAYKGFKQYVNKQLAYTDRELMKVWNTGRLDVELRRGNKLINWVGIYAREADKSAQAPTPKEAPKQKPAKKDSAPDTSHEFDRILETVRACRSEAELSALRVDELIPEGMPDWQIDAVHLAVKQQPDVIKYNTIVRLLRTGKDSDTIDECERILATIQTGSVAKAASLEIRKAWQTAAEPR